MKKMRSKQKLRSIFLVTKSTVYTCNTASHRQEKENRIESQRDWVGQNHERYNRTGQTSRKPTSSTADDFKYKNCYLSWIILTEVRNSSLVLRLFVQNSGCHAWPWRGHRAVFLLNSFFNPPWSPWRHVKRVNSTADDSNTKIVTADTPEMGRPQIALKSTKMTA